MPLTRLNTRNDSNEERNNEEHSWNNILPVGIVGFHAWVGPASYTCSVSLFGAKEEKGQVQRRAGQGRWLV